MPRQVVRCSPRLLWNQERGDTTSNGELGTNRMGSNLPRQVVRRPVVRTQVPDKNPVRSDEMEIPRKMTQASCSARMLRNIPKQNDRLQH